MYIYKWVAAFLETMADKNHYFEIIIIVIKKLVMLLRFIFLFVVDEALKITSVTTHKNCLPNRICGIESS